MPSKYRRTFTIGHNVEGKPIVKNFCGRTKREVQERIDKYKIEIATGQKQGPDIILFSSWAYEWLAIYKEKNVGQSMYNLYRLCIKHFEEYFGTVPITTIRNVDLMNFFKEKQNLSQSMVSKLRITANGIFKSAQENGIIQGNPMYGIKPIGIQTSEKSTYNYEQVKIICEYAKTHRFGIGVYIILNTGLRRGELMGLKRDNFDFKNNRISVTHSVTDTNGHSIVKIGGKTKAAKRIIPLSPEVSDFLAQSNQIKRDDFIFESRYGNVIGPRTWARKHYGVFLNDFEQYVLEKKLEDPTFPDIPQLTPHELRHTFGTLLFKAGTDIYTIQKVMGHSSVEITVKTYIHEDIEDIEKNIRWISTVPEKSKNS